MKQTRTPATEMAPHSNSPARRKNAKASHKAKRPSPLHSSLKSGLTMDIGPDTRMEWMQLLERCAVHTCN